MWRRCLLVLAGILSVLPAEWCAAEPAGETCTRLKELIPCADIGLLLGVERVADSALVERLLDAAVGFGLAGL